MALSLQACLYADISEGKRGLKEENLNLMNASLYLEKVKCDSFVFLGGMPVRKVVFPLYVWQRSQCGCSISGVWHAFGLGRGQGGAYILIAKQKLQLNVVLLCGAGFPPPPPRANFTFVSEGSWNVGCGPCKPRAMAMLSEPAGLCKQSLRCVTALGRNVTPSFCILPP